MNSGGRFPTKELAAIYFNNRQTEMKYFAFFPFLAIVLLLNGCEEYDTQTVSVIGSQANIKFTPMEFGDAASTVTRSSQTTTSTITSFGVTASIYAANSDYTEAECGSYFYNTEIEAATGVSKYFWPGEDKRLSFYAYVPYGSSELRLSESTKLGYPSYSYTVPQGVAEQVDFMTADVLNHSGAATETPVTLTFYHRCANIRFKVYNRNTTSPITVKSISVCGMKYAGIFENNAWTLTGSINTSSTHPFVFATDTSIPTETTVDVTGETCQFMVLPQTVAVGTNFLVIKTTENDSEKTYTYDLESNLILVEGKSYTFALELGDGTLIVDPNTEIQDWAPEVKYLGVETVGSNNDWAQPPIENGEDNGIEDWVEE